MSLGFKFWGVRGSLATEPVKENLHNYIADTIEYVLDNKDKSKEELLEALYENNIVCPLGANTACVEVLNSKQDPSHITILDAGSGIKWLGDDIVKNRPGIKRINLFISHTHWDHIIGFPFFTPAYIGRYEIHIYSATENIEKRIRRQQDKETFPISIDDMSAKIVFHQLDVAETTQCSGHKVSMKLNDHPGKAYSFKINNGEASIAYMTDAEVNIDNIDIFETYYASFLKDVSILIFDAQYDYLQSYSELSDKAGWGHSSSIIGVDICNIFKINKLLLFHYDPSNSDREIYRHYDQAVYYKKSNQYDFPTQIQNSKEGHDYFTE